MGAKLVPFGMAAQPRMEPHERPHVEELRILLAWEAGELSEGQAATWLRTDRVTARRWRALALKGAAELWAAFAAEKGGDGGG